MTNTNTDTKSDILTTLIDKAKARGADAAEAVMVDGTSLSIAVRMGETEKVERSEGADLGLRVLIGKRQACVSSSDTTPAALDELLDRAIAMAKSVPEDPYCGIADADQLATDIPDVDACDPAQHTAEDLIALAIRAEDAARAVPGVTNSEGAEAGWGTSSVVLASSNGFLQASENSHIGLSTSVLAGNGTAMERDYDYTSGVYAADMMSPETIGTSAGEKAVKRLNPRKVATKSVPVVFDARVARSVVGHLISAINGASVARGTTFLKDKMGAKLFAPGVNIIEDPHRRRGLRSRPFDGEGLPTVRRNIIDDGVLTTWLLNLRSARQLGLAPTGHGTRSVSSPPGIATANVYLEPGKQTPADMIGALDEGFYVTELIGFGINEVTGDYSRGASGFWIEKGEIAYPVSELTIAGTLPDMFARLTPANDLVMRYGTDSPSVLVEGLTVAGV